MILSDATVFFKFQSDSINTDKNDVEAKRYINFKFQSDSINTNKVTSLRTSAVNFKFQSDSINTLIRYDVR